MPATLAAKYTGRWIFFSPATKGYKNFKKSLTLQDALGQISMTGPYTTGASTTAGQPAERVKGFTTALSSKKKKGTAALYLAATGTPLPLRYTGSGTASKHKATITVTFSQWGVKVEPKAPQTTVSASSIEQNG
jgi:hypothetical protein